MTPSSYSWKDLKRDTKNPAVVGLTFFAFLSGLALSWPLGWSFVFAMMLGFVIFDIIFGSFVRGKTIPISGDHMFKPKGWRFAAYLFGIGVASIASTLFSQSLADSLSRDPSTRLLAVLGNGLLMLFLWVDFKSRLG